MTQNHEGEEDFEEELSFTEEDLEAFEEESEPQPPQAEVPAEEPAPASQETQESALTPLDQLPITIAIEVAQIKMTADRLLQLQPGNVLETPTAPTTQVKLSINGRPVGRGELLQVGDVLGVRVTELG